jgi:hypothetical protein
MVGASDYPQDLKQDAAGPQKKRVSAKVRRKVYSPSWNPALLETTAARPDPKSLLMEPARWWYAVGKGVGTLEPLESFPSGRGLGLVLGVSRRSSKISGYDKAEAFVKACSNPRTLPRRP